MKLAFLPNTRTWLMLSGGLIVASIIAVATLGIRFGIDFTGGTSLEVSFAQEVPQTVEIITAVETTLGADKDVSVVGVLGKPAVIIRSKSLEQDEINQLEDAFAVVQWQASIDKIQTIGPNIGATFLQRSVWALLLAFLTIVVFVAWAFRKVPEGYSSWKFGLTAIAALLHDIVITIGVFAVLGTLLGVEADALFVTALLTILGFSVNDTIVIFDRLREGLHRDKGKNHLTHIAEQAVQSSLNRSLLTSISTLIVLGALLAYFISFDNLFFFFLALSIGVIIGTYSSLCVATPLLVWAHRK